MIEFFKHLFGACGDGHAHPTIWWLIGAGAAYVSYYFYLIKHKITWCWKKGCEYCAKHIKIKN